MITKPKPGAMLNPLHPLSKGLVLCQLFNEGAGSLANDISGNKNHGSLKNMAPNVQGSGWGGSKHGGSLKFDGVDDYVDCGSDASLDITDAITVGAWVKRGLTLGTYQRIIDKRYSAYSLALWTDNKINLNIEGFDGDNNKFSILAITDNNWHHIVGTFGNSVWAIYIDGVLDNNGIDSGSINTNADNILIGVHTNGSQFFNGSIDSVRIYNRALSAEEVRLSYEQPFCMMMTPRITTLLKMLGSLDKNNQFLLDSLNCKVMQLGNTRINTWNTLGRPTAKRGIIGFNTTTNKIEVYDGSAWKSVSLS